MNLFFSSPGRTRVDGKEFFRQVRYVWSEFFCSIFSYVVESCLTNYTEGIYECDTRLRANYTLCVYIFNYDPAVNCTLLYTRQFNDHSRNFVFSSLSTHLTSIYCCTCRNRLSYEQFSAFLANVKV
jgi:hypothetical protein